MKKKDSENRVERGTAAKAGRDRRMRKEARKAEKARRAEEARRAAKTARQADHAATEPDENLFNRTSDRVHGYSSRLKRYVRLSIGLRASAGYALLLWRMLVPMMLLLTVLYGCLRAGAYVSQRDEALAALPDGETEGVEILLLPAGVEPGGWIFYEGWGVYVQEQPLEIFLQYAQDDGMYTVQLLFSLREDAFVLRGLLFGLAGLVLLCSVSFLIHGHRLNAKLLQPISDIAETAQQMSEKNLSSRINVAGTQNELRDLAVVINDMLDRIETAYNRQKQFVSDASHELRTPIAVLQGYAGLLKRWGKDNPDVRDEAIAAIASETQSMKELVENLLFLARHDKKTLSLSFAPFDSAEMLRELVKETEIIAVNHRVIGGTLAECTLLGDRAMVKQAVRIFVDNALKYTPPGGCVEIASRRLAQSLLITVSDNGPGIKKADLLRIFDRFYRADAARSGQVAGHGLGLSIARTIALSHNGKIHVKSKPGQGSAFSLELPAPPV